VLSVIVGAAGALIVVVVTVAFFRRLSSGTSRTVAVPAGTALASWRGGVKTRTVSGAGRVARLELFDWGVQVRSAGLFTWLGFTWQARYAEMARAQLIRFPVANRGVLLRTDGCAAPLVFVTHHDRDVIDLLQAHGVPVDRSAARLRPDDLAG
jgi:hypothetical protein